MRGRRLLVLLALSVTGIAGLLGLGFWQLERLEWKMAILANLERALSPDTQPIKLAEAETMMGRDPSQDFLRVSLVGTFDHADERYLFSTLNGEPGWKVITPFLTSDRRLVMIERGFVPQRLKQPQDRPASMSAGEIALTGLLRKPAQPGLFTPSNQSSENTWYWLDVPALLASLKSVPPGFVPSDYLVEVLPGSTGEEWPKATAPDPARIPNNHRQYAMTWFALAAVLAFMTVALVRRGGG
jgi:surfeit locus 1 family protein